MVPTTKSSQPSKGGEGRGRGHTSAWLQENPCPQAPMQRVPLRSWHVDFFAYSSVVNTPPPEPATAPQSVPPPGHGSLPFSSSLSWSSSPTVAVTRAPIGTQTAGHLALGWRHQHLLMMWMPGSADCPAVASGSVPYGWTRRRGSGGDARRTAGATVLLLWRAQSQRCDARKRPARHPLPRAQGT